MQRNDGKSAKKRRKQNSIWQVTWMPSTKNPGSGSAWIVKRDADLKHCYETKISFFILHYTNHCHRSRSRLGIKPRNIDQWIRSESTGIVTVDFRWSFSALCCDVQGSRHLLSFGYDDHLSSGPEIQEEEREGGTEDTLEVPEMWNAKYYRLVKEMCTVQLTWFLRKQRKDLPEVPEMRR